MMRWLIAGLLILLGGLQAIPQPTPNPKVTVPLTDSLRLDSALQYLTTNYNLQFAYDADLLKQKYTYQDVNGQPLDAVLHMWLSPHGLAYEHTAQAILVYPKTGEANGPGKETPKRIQGKVVDALTGESLPYAHLSLLPGHKITAADGNGRFVFLHAETPPQAIAASYIGYASDTLLLARQADKPYYTVELQPQSRALAEVTVEEKRQGIMRTNRSPGTHTVDPFQLETIATLGQGNIMQAVQLLPGISAAGEASGGMHVRGGKADQNLVLFDGFTIYHIDHVYGIFDAINADAVKHIRVYKGGFPARYGDRSSSVVDITGKKGNQKKFSARAGLDFMSARGRLETPLGKQQTALVTFRHSFTEWLQKDLYNDLLNTYYQSESRKRRQVEEIAERVDLSPEVRFYDINAKLSHQSEKLGQLSISAFSGYDRLNIQERTEEEQRGYDLQETSTWGNTGIAGQWDHPWNARHKTSLNTAFSRYQGASSFQEAFLFGQGRNNRALELSQDNKLQDLGIRAVHGFHWNKHFTRAGVASNWYQAHFLHSFNGDALGDIRQNTFKLAAFAENQLQITPRWHLNAGLRGLYHQPQNQWLAEPRLSTYYQANSSLTLKAAYGWYHQFISQLQTDRLQSGEPVYWLLADNQLFNPSTAYHYIAGAQYRLNNWLLDAEGYYKFTRNITATQALFQPFAGASNPDAGLNIPSGGSNTSYGLDVMLQRTHGNLSGWLTYSCTISQNRFESLNDGKKYPPGHHRPHELNMVAQYQRGQWQWGAKWIFATGSPYTRPDPEQPTQILFDTDNLNAYRLPNYHRLDITAIRNIKINKVFGQIGLSLVNVYNRSNLRSRVFRLDYEEPQEAHGGQPKAKVVAYDLELLHFTPNFFLRIEF